ncbi:MAG: hypothetical protein WCF67_07575 [Chitinophagaceae bacterium]
MQVYLLSIIFWGIGLLSPDNTASRKSAAENRPAAIACIPVKLLAFSGKSDGSSNILQWQTTSEVNTREFIIEKSADGDTYTLFAWVAPKGGLNGPAMYRYTDTAAASDTHYRLRMVDADGKEQISRPVFISKKPAGK